MNKKSFIKNLKDAGDFEEEIANGVYKVFVETLKSSILEGEGKILLPELGKFEIKLRKARQGINPNTGEKIEIPEKKILKFQASKLLLEHINNI